MKVFVLFIALYYLPGHSFSQSLIEIYNNHNFPCENESGTSAANLCAGTKAQFVDSLMNGLYHKILKSIEGEIAENNLVIRREKNAKDSTRAKSGLQAKDYYLRMKQAIINSQSQWIKSRDLNCEVEAVFCEGGTGCPAMVSEVYISDTLERIKKLESFEF